MVTTIQEHREAIALITENDREMRAIHAHLDNILDLPADQTLILLSLLNELKGGMRNGIVHFSFRKKDGTVRQAYGTRSSEVIDRYEGPAKETKQANLDRPEALFPYFDIEKQQFRSFKVENIIDIDNGYTI